MRWLKPFVACFLLSAYGASAADIKAEQSAALYDLLSGVEVTGAPFGVDEAIYQDVASILKQERLLPSGSRPRTNDAGRLKEVGAALALHGPMAKKYAKEVADIDNLLTRGNDADLRHAVSNLWAKIGRKRPNDTALKPILQKLGEVGGGAPLETINHVIDKADYRIEITHAREGEQIKVVVSRKDAQGDIRDRTVFQGHRYSRVNKKGDDLERHAHLDRVCTNTAQSDALIAETLQGEWSQKDADNTWTISGTPGDLLVVDDRAGEKLPHRYQSTLKLGKIEGKHIIQHADEIGSTLPATIRQQLANGQHSFRIHLEHCPSHQGKLAGTWSSQHVTYNGMFMQVSKVHDPYDEALELRNDEADQAFKITDVSIEYDRYQARMKTLLRSLMDEEAELAKQREANKALQKTQRQALGAAMTEIGQLDDQKAQMFGESADSIQLTQRYLSASMQMRELSSSLSELVQQSAALHAEQIRLDTLREGITELSAFDAETPSDYVPQLHRIVAKADGNTVLERHIKPQNDVLQKLTNLIAYFKQQQEMTGTQIAELKDHIASTKKQRKQFVDDASTANQKVQASYRNLSDSIEGEMWARWFVQTTTDIAEVWMEGKTPAGALLEAVTKLGEAYFISGMGNSFQMYKPDRIVGDAIGKQLKQHWQDPYTADLTETGKAQLGRSFAGFLEELVLAAGKTGEKVLQTEALNQTVQNQIRTSVTKASEQLASAQNARNLYTKTLAAIAEQQMGLAHNVANAATKAQKEALQNTQKQLIAEAADILKKRAARIAAAEAAQHSLATVSKELSEELAKDGFKNALKGVNPKFIGKLALDGGAGVGKGLAWDGFRGLLQTQIDLASEAMWHDYLQLCFAASVKNKLMKKANLKLAAHEYDLRLARAQQLLNGVILRQAQLIYQEYIYKAADELQLHRLTDAIIKQDTGALIIDITMPESTHGETVLLRGDLKTVALEYKSEGTFPESPSYEQSPTALAEMILSAKKGNAFIRPPKTWRYQLPQGTSLADISTTGKLSLVVQPR